jgi:hypothetical protein
MIRCSPALVNDTERLDAIEISLARALMKSVFDSEFRQCRCCCLAYVIIRRVDIQSQRSMMVFLGSVETIAQ